MDKIEGISKFERLFRLSSGLDVDKTDLKRLDGFISHKISDLLLMAQATAKANDREFIYPWDVPITKGLQEHIDRFKEFDENLDIEPILEDIAGMPEMDLGYSVEFSENLAEIAGGLVVSLSDVFKVIDPDLKNPGSDQWDKAFEVYDILL